jgi:DDE superfamily endonuclease
MQHPPASIRDAEQSDEQAERLGEFISRECFLNYPALGKPHLAHPRFHLHFTPTYSSWINQVERWFAELERRCLERGVFCSLDELKTALEEWIKTWNEQARPFKWIKTADQIIDRICHYCDSISGPGH